MPPLNRKYVLLLSVLVAVALLPPVVTWCGALSQDRLYIENELDEPLTKLRITFMGYNNRGSMGPERSLVFHNVASTGKQWQPFGPDWGNLDSGRFFKIEGVTASGVGIGSPELFEEVTAIGPLIDVGLGARFYITVRKDNTLRVLPN